MIPNCFILISSNIISRRKGNIAARSTTFIGENIKRINFLLNAVELINLRKYSKEKMEKNAISNLFSIDLNPIILNY